MRFLILLFVVLAASGWGQVPSADKERLDTLLAKARIDQIQCISGPWHVTNKFSGRACENILRSLSATNRLDAPALNTTNSNPAGFMVFYWETLPLGSSLSCHGEGVLVFGSYHFRLKENDYDRWFFPYQAYEGDPRTKRRRVGQ
jgi:hypothetical protein